MNINDISAWLAIGLLGAISTIVALAFLSALPKSQIAAAHWDEL